MKHLILIPLIIHSALGAMKQDNALKKENYSYCIPAEQLIIRVLYHKLEYLPEELKTKIMKLLKPPFSNVK